MEVKKNDLILMHQTHSKKVVEITKNNLKKKEKIFLDWLKEKNQKYLKINFYLLTKQNENANSLKIIKKCYKIYQFLRIFPQKKVAPIGLKN